ncbi:hypothetical protein [Verminephrobacter aporrectodeae]|uniref:hypothetical protein n=1 Tax=Verminephrobacter aporrectodeae TaxID=1110389 RepID=UPI0022378D16|nr:hypothetical protein [Verminephrobacter aporrectodeae]
MFYDGVLLCLAKKPDAARVPLLKVSKIFSDHRKLTNNFIFGNLNMLLLGRGMEPGTGCRDYLTAAVFSGV